MAFLGELGALFGKLKQKGGGGFHPWELAAAKATARRKARKLFQKGRFYTWTPPRSLKRRQKGGFYGMAVKRLRRRLQKGGFYDVGIKRLYGLAKQTVRRKARKLWQKGKQTVRRKAVKLLQEALRQEATRPQKGGMSLLYGLTPQQRGWGRQQRGGMMRWINFLKAQKARRQKGGTILPTLHPNDATFFTEALRRRQMTRI